LLFPQSKAPGLTSCDLQLTDLPKAKPYVQAGERALVDARVATQHALDQGAIFISDDPLDASLLIFSAQVSTGVAYTLPGLPTPAFGGPLMHSRGVVAFVTRTTHRVTLAGFDPWENGE